MTAPSTPRGKPTALRLAGIGLLAVGVAVALYAAGRLHQPDYAFSLFGQSNPIGLKSLLATIALGAAGLQVLLALWIYRKLPLAGSPPRPVPLAHPVLGFGLVALTLPIAVHCLIAYGVQLTSAGRGASLAGCFFYGAFVAKVLLVHSRRLPGLAAAGSGGNGRGGHWRAVVLLGAVVLQRLPASAHLSCHRFPGCWDRASVCTRRVGIERNALVAAWRVRPERLGNHRRAIHVPQERRVRQSSAALLVSVVGRGAAAGVAR